MLAYHSMRPKKSVSETADNMKCDSHVHKLGMPPETFVSHS